MVTDSSPAASCLLLIADELELANESGEMAEVCCAEVIEALHFGDVGPRIGYRRDTQVHDMTAS